LQNSSPLIATSIEINLLSFESLEDLKKHYGFFWQRLQATCSSLFRETVRPSIVKVRAITIIGIAKFFIFNVFFAFLEWFYQNAASPIL